MTFLDELKRRNVIRIAGVYLVGAWLIVQVSGTLLPMFDAPAWVSRSIVILLAVGFFPALILAWAFELTPQGLKRERDVERVEAITPRTGNSDVYVTGCSPAQAITSITAFNNLNNTANNNSNLPRFVDFVAAPAAGTFSTLAWSAGRATTVTIPGVGTFTNTPT